MSNTDEDQEVGKLAKRRGPSHGAEISSGAEYNRYHFRGW
ncbi:hypothetical protein CCACVL1_23735 [Corchorus capsularis]|uniref:Uncharacterized protein n=1 Tax=Corchorus capsularis TaxID=210143 RepID=A0A1R3GSM8_COCAP|nr:hypothetical protein CCACVL1_23735 [Corchorus capsularis]